MPPRDTQQKRLSLRRRPAGAEHHDALSDSELVELSRRGDELAYAELWRRHSRAGITVARSTSSSLDPEDLVAEAFTKIFQAVQNGKGPQVGFRPYLFTTIRNLAASWGRDRREAPLEEAETIPDPETTESRTMQALDRSLTAQAFRSLPDRWQEVLWYCDVEQMNPAAVAPLLGLTPNGVSALAYRAREGLRQSWIRVHLQSIDEDSECRWVTDRMGAYSRGKLAARETARFEKHLVTCARCTVVLGEADEVGSRLALIVLPLTVGAGAATAYAAWVQGGHNAVSAASATSAPMPSSVTGTVSAAGSSGGAVGGAATGGVAAAWISGSALLAAAAVAGTLVLGPQLFAGRPDEPATVAAPPVAAGPRSSADAGRGRTPDPGGDQPVLAPVAPTAPPAGPESGTRQGEQATAPSPAASPDTRTNPTAPAAPTTPAVPTTPTTPAVPTDPTGPTTPQAPDAPVVTSAWDATRPTAATSASISGTGASGATVVVSAELATASASAVRSASTATGASGTPSAATGALLASVTVLPSGAWSLSADLGALADGQWTLRVVQRAGNAVSAPVSLGLVVDRTAEAPRIGSVDTGSGELASRMAPIVSGVAEPGATVVVSDGDRTLATVTADTTGAWTTGELILASESYTLTARQTDVAGNVSPASAAVTGTAGAPDVLAVGAPLAAILVVRGDPGATAEVWMDGAATGRTLVLDDHGYAVTAFAVQPGDHRVGAVIVSGDRHGVLADTFVRVRRL
jgi:RNA polymerase sigma factor (sigma-70 family)